MEARWRRALKKHFGASSCNKWSQLAADVQCVGVGLKPVYLLDSLQPDGTKLCSLLEDVLSSTEEGKQWLRDLCVLVVKSDILLVNWSAVQNTFSSSGKSNTYVIITKPTQTPGSPSMADPDEFIRVERASALAAQIEKEASVWYANVLAEVGKLYSSNSEEKLLQCVDTVVPPGMNVCTLFGRLLGYPVIYWFDPVQGYSLDMVELAHYSVAVSTVAVHSRVRNVKVRFLSSKSLPVGQFHQPSISLFPCDS